MDESHDVAKPTNNGGRVAAIVALVVLFGAAIIGVLALNGSDDEPQVAADTTPPSSTTPNTETPSTTAPPPDTTTTTEPQLPAELAALISGDFADETIRVWVYDNTVAQNLIRLTPESFTDLGGPEVEFIFYEDYEPDDDLTASKVVRYQTERDFGDDVVMIGGFYGSLFGANGWLRVFHREVETIFGPPFEGVFRDDEVADLIPSVRETLSHVDLEEDLKGGGLFDGDLFALPIQADGSLLMFNREILRNAGVELSENPTWNEVETTAAAVHTNDIAGICIRTAPASVDNRSVLAPSHSSINERGSDGLIEPLTSMVNAFGGTWWEANEDGTPGEAQINQPDSGFRQATEFYATLVQEFGPDEPNLGFDECFEQFANGQVAMWFDSTVAPNLLNDLDAAVSPNAGNFGAVASPIGPTGIRSDWLNISALALRTSYFSRDDSAVVSAAAAEFVRWASSEEFTRLVTEDLGWQAAPTTRLSTLANPEYQQATTPWGQVVSDAITNADPNNPGTTPRPGLSGVQYVGIPEFRSVGNDCSVEFASAIAGEITVNDALDNCQAIAAQASQ